MLKKLLIVIAMGAVTATAFADDAVRANAKETLVMKDGSTLVLFKDGKMALEDKYGRARRMTKGMTLETKDGRQVVVDSDEVSRLDSLIKQGHGGR